MYRAIQLFLILISTSILFSQVDYFYSCGTQVTSPKSVLALGPLYKPIKTLPLNDPLAYYRILVVFVEFKNDNSFEPNSPYWAPNQPPRYIDSIVAYQKNFSGYPNHVISDFFNQVIRDSFDVIGDALHLTLPNTYGYYKNTFGNNDSGRNEANRDVLRMLDTNVLVDWNDYDQWSWNGSAFVRTPDNYIDMVYIQYRRGKPDFFNISSGGHADLMVDYNTLRQNKYLRAGTIHMSSGLYGINGASEPKTTVLDYFVHEYTHYLIGDHQPYSRISGGDGSKTDAGFERTYTPQDQILLNIANVQTVDWSNQLYQMPDFVTTGRILKVPAIISSNFFLICNRRRISKYDRNMGGDTVRSEFFGNAGEYDKGIYIYHVFDGDNFASVVDMECADGLWNWTYDSPISITPDWSNTQYLPTFRRISVGRDDDDPREDYPNPRRILSRDGMSVISQGWGNLGYHKKWFSAGKRHAYLGDPGLERTYANNIEFWCSRECVGDRYDAWKLEDNHLFSPYSSPNTKALYQSWGGDHTGVFIYYVSQIGNTANVKVYRTGYGGYSENQILSVTPPSKPLLFRINMVNCNGTYGHPMITWDNNMEPDMVRSGNFKRYKIYRAGSSSDNVAPYNYIYTGLYDDYTPNDTANFIDNSPVNGARIYCTEDGNGENDTYYRYKIAAVDNTDWESAKSDFVPIKGHSNIPDNITFDNEEPLEFSLEQNYPNPFNPSTEIMFSIPYTSFVSLRVYDATGQLVATLVNNEYRVSGRYSSVFDASKLASGIYFYKLEALNLVDTRKMVLIK